MTLLRSSGIEATVDDYRMYLPLNVKGIGHSLAAWGYRELDQRFILSRISKPGINVLDLGANIGYYVAMHGRMMQYSGHIIAVEPDLRSLEFLRRNTILNNMTSMVQIHPIALSDKDGTFELQLADLPNLSSLHRSTLKRKYVGNQSVEVRDFARYLDSIGRRMDLVRMDIEGGEVDVLKSLARGAQQLVARSLLPRNIVFEGHAWEYQKDPASNPMQRCIVEMQKLGYRARYISSCDSNNPRVADSCQEPLITIEDRTRTYTIYESLSDTAAVELISGDPSVTTVCLALNE